MIMRKVLTSAVALLFLMSCDNSSELGLSGVDPSLTVKPTQIMVLGTAHLSAHSDELTLKDLEPLLERLEIYAPDIITIESSSGMVCNRVKLYPREHEGYADNYCFNGELYRSESGLSVSEGSFQARKALLDWPDVPTPAERKTLAAAFLASEEPESALVQWLQINSKDKSTGNGLGIMSVEFLTKYELSINESRSIAARLAARLGLQKVYYADDHGSFLSAEGEDEAYGARLNELWPQEGDSCFARWDSTTKKLTAGDVIGAYRDYNDKANSHREMDCDWKRTMNDDEPEGYGRKYTLDWQARNFRMVSMIAAAAIDKPGGKILSIVGTSHKPYFEAYLDQMHDIEIVSTDEVLK